MPVSRRCLQLEIGLRAAVHAGGRRLAGAVRGMGPTDLFLCVVDHFEPQVGRPERSVARRRLEQWLRRYPAIAASCRDADGRPPKHGFFYPWDEYDEWEADRLAELCADGWGELDLHLHHRDDTEASLRRKLREALAAYRGHGALSRWPDGRAAFGFIHGNWALANSRCEGGQNFCGVDAEVKVLAEEGCFADFTFPAWPHTAQPRRVNSFYYAVGDLSRRKCYDSGIPIRAGGVSGGGFPILQGPLVPYIDRQRGRPRVAMDDGDLAAYRRYRPERLDRWVRAGIHVMGRPDRVFIKLHCHGADDANCSALLDEDLPALFRDAACRYNDGVRYRLHHVTARELFNIVKATEACAPVSIEEARDWILPPPSGNGRPGGEAGERTAVAVPAA